MGERNAARSYQLCINPIDTLDTLARTLPLRADFKRTKSFFYASRRADVAIKIDQEFAIRRKHGIRVARLDESDIAKLFPFRAPAALLSADAAQVDAYRLTHALLQASVARGAKVFDKTEITNIVHHPRSLTLETAYGHTVRARTLVIANGYESFNYLPFNSIRLHSTFVITSEPLATADIWYKNCLIWESATPYLYMRTTVDRRIIVGGRDEPSFYPHKRDQLLTRKTRELKKDFTRKFPDLPFRVDFAWAGTFAETKGGLPYIGTIKQYPHTYFALGFGGNGITFSVISAEIIRDAVLGRHNKDVKIFGFERRDDTA